MADKTIRATVSNPQSWWTACKAQAERDEISFSEWIYEVSVANLDEDLLEEVGDRSPLGRPASRSEKVDLKVVAADCQGKIESRRGLKKR